MDYIDSVDSIDFTKPIDHGCYRIDRAYRFYRIHRVYIHSIDFTDSIDCLYLDF